APRLEELLQRLAAEVRHHLRVGHALGARQLLEAEEARAVVLHRLPVEAAHHFFFRFAQPLHGFLGLLEEQLALFCRDERVQETVEAQAPRASFQIENILTQTAPPPSPWSSASSSSNAPSSRARRARRA